jgi:hypothetical protein
MGGSAVQKKLLLVAASGHYGCNPAIILQAMPRGRARGQLVEFSHGKISDLQAIAQGPDGCHLRTSSAEAESLGYDPYDYYFLGHYHQRGRTETWFGNKSQLLNLC